LKIIKIVATRCRILRLKCIKFNFGWDSTPDPVEGAYGASRPLARFKGPTYKGRRGERWKWRERKGPLYFFLRIYAHGLQHCLQILTAETIKVYKFCTIHLLILDQYVSPRRDNHISKNQTRYSAITYSYRDGGRHFGGLAP